MRGKRSVSVPAIKAGENARDLFPGINPVIVVINPVTWVVSPVIAVWAWVMTFCSAAVSPARLSAFSKFCRLSPFTSALVKSRVTR